jgi:hypothetical protein
MEIEGAQIARRNLVFFRGEINVLQKKEDVESYFVPLALILVVTRKTKLKLEELKQNLVPSVRNVLRNILLLILRKKVF